MIPTMMNCQHGGSGWCLECVGKLAAERDAALSALAACEVSMDTAALHGVGDILPPAYRDSWARAHTRARALLEGK